MKPTHARKVIRAAYAAGDDAAVARALKALDALKAPVAVA